MRLGGWTRRLGGWTKLQKPFLDSPNRFQKLPDDSRSSWKLPEARKTIFQWFSVVWVARLGVLEAGLSVLEAGQGVVEAGLGVLAAGLSCQNHSLTAQIDSSSSQTTPEAPRSCQKLGKSIFQWF